MRYRSTSSFSGRACANQLDANPLIVALRTPLWLRAGWGCPDQRLPRGRRSRDTRRELWLRRRKARKHGLGQDRPGHLKENGLRHHDGPEIFETRQRRPLRYAPSTALAPECRRGTLSRPVVVAAIPIHKVKQLPRTPSLALDYWSGARWRPSGPGASKLSSAYRKDSSFPSLR